MKLKFDNVELTIPESWADVKMSDYVKWGFQMPETKLEIIEHVANICKTDAKVFLNAPTEVFNIVSDAVQFAFNHDYEPKSSIEINNTIYCINTSEKLTLAEWVDIDSVLSDENHDLKILEILAIVCRTIGEVYNSNNIEERKNLFLSQTCDKILPLLAFFLSKEKKLQNVLSHYSTAMEQANQLALLIPSFAKNGAGTKRLTIWHKVKYYFLMKSLKKQLSKCSGFYYTDKTNNVLNVNN